MPDYRARHGPKGLAEGAYLFKVDLDNLRAFQYSTLDTDVAYEHGQYSEQWTLRYQNETTNQAASVKVRFFPGQPVEFEVELSEIPINDGKGKDVTVNWRLYHFNANNTFWTDSNGLEMQERKLNFNPGFDWNKDQQNISSNFYPVDSAIAIRDAAKGMQATVINDRAQAGSADL